MNDQQLTAGRGRAARVLLVEDDPDIRQAMAELLQDEGYEYILAGNGFEALEALCGQRPSLLLIDLVMPVMNGLELINRLSEDARWRDIPVVIMTAAGDRIMGVDLASLNVPILRKPLDIGHLARILANLPAPSAVKDAAQSK